MLLKLYNKYNYIILYYCIVLKYVQKPLEFLEDAIYSRLSFPNLCLMIYGLIVSGVLSVLSKVPNDNIVTAPDYSFF